MQDPKELLAQMGITPEDVDENWHRREKYRAEDRVICTCGHAKNRHTIENDFVTCNPSRINCACGHYVPVLKVQDTRDFLSSTKGAGPLHALIRGIRTTLKKERKVEWIDDHYKCGMCGAQGNEKQLTITPLEGSPETGMRKSIEVEFARYNGFLCDDCWEKM
jgi:hypothetical protein